ncbi:hypothetical protein PQX77_005317 [Marasmius sp. AFHP31]|nr:hypothetical protein PQX77_005317 [Marasmius sp. AFHP31]
MSDDWHTVSVQIPFSSEKHALIAKRSIEVDPELQAHAVKRTITVEGNMLHGEFTTLTIRLARLTVNAFLENVDLVVRTIAEFGQEAEQQPS